MYTFKKQVSKYKKMSNNITFTPKNTCTTFITHGR